MSLQFANLGIAVAIVVVGFALAGVTKDDDAGTTVVADQRGIERIGEIPRLATDKVSGVAYTGAVVAWFAGDDVDDAGNGMLP